jgi:hypothetical protein
MSSYDTLLADAVRLPLQARIQLIVAGAVQPIAWEQIRREASRRLNGAG